MTNEELKQIPKQNLNGNGSPNSSSGSSGYELGQNGRRSTDSRVSIPVENSNGNGGLSPSQLNNNNSSSDQRYENTYKQPRLLVSSVFNIYGVKLGGNYI